MADSNRVNLQQSESAHVNAATSSTTGAHQPSAPLPSQELTPLEQSVLDEYARLSANLVALNESLGALADAPTAQILDELRGLERKTSLVFTLLKASVYSIVLQQEVWVGNNNPAAPDEGSANGQDGAATGQTG